MLNIENNEKYISSQPSVDSVKIENQRKKEIRYNDINKLLAFPCNFPLSIEAIMMPGRLWQDSVYTETGGLQSRFSILCSAGA